MTGNHIYAVLVYGFVFKFKTTGSWRMWIGLLIQQQMMAAKAGDAGIRRWG